jgi:hypothetical protein
MNKILYILVLFIVIHSSAQVRMTGTTINSVNSSAFIDASSNIASNGTVGAGKGLVFPRVDLSTFSFVGTTGIPNNFPFRFDGMIVYNTKEAGVAGAGATQGTLTPGFWFYENKSTTSVTGGTWKPVAATSVVKDITTTEVELPLKVDGAQLYAVKGSFTATGTSAAVTITKPLGMTSHYAISILKEGKLFRNQISSFDLVATTNNVITGSGLFSETYPAGTYDYILEYFK